MPLKLILASRSPQRIKLLADAGIMFATDPADIDESTYSADLPPAKIAEFLARAKANWVLKRHPDAIVLGADTVVVGPDGQLLGKPADANHARRMLAGLSGSIHSVITGIALLGSGTDRVGHVETTVRMRPLTPVEIETYVASGDWQGKAGGYGIQDDDPFVTAIEGSVSNVIGLPMETAIAWLAASGIAGR